MSPNLGWFGRRKSKEDPDPITDAMKVLRSAEVDLETSKQISRKVDQQAVQADQISRRSYASRVRNNYGEHIEQTLVRRRHA